jgi:hypothetical protein
VTGGDEHGLDGGGRTLSGDQRLLNRRQCTGQEVRQGVRFGRDSVELLGEAAAFGVVKTRRSTSDQPFSQCMNGIVLWRKMVERSQASLDRVPVCWSEHHRKFGNNAIFFRRVRRHLDRRSPERERERRHDDQRHHMCPPGLAVVRGRVFHAAGRAAAALLCVAGVPVVTLILVRAFYGVPISAYRPIINDEVAYWRQARTFSYAGFHGGDYTVAEATNVSGSTSFGPHGPGPAVLYGVLGAAFGWHRHTVVLLNLLAISVAAWTWISLGRMSLARLFLGGVLLVTSWHIVLWAPTGMQEPVHHAGAIAMAAFFATALGPHDVPG